MSSICAWASTGLMTEIWFTLVLAQTYTHAYTHLTQNTHSQEGGPVSLDKLLPMAENSPCCAAGQLVQCKVVARHLVFMFHCAGLVCMETYSCILNLLSHVSKSCVRDPSVHVPLLVKDCHLLTVEQIHTVTHAHCSLFTKNLFQR